jgi:hypothetical protein
VIKSDQKQEKQTEEPKAYCNQFDLTKRVPAEVLEKANTKILSWDNDEQDDYETLLNQIRKVVLDGNFSSAIPVAPGTPRHALRVAIHSLASPSWQSKSAHVSPGYVIGSSVFTRFFIGFIQVLSCSSWFTSFFIWYCCNYCTSLSL